MSLQKAKFTGRISKQIAFDYFLYLPKDYSKDEKKWPLVLFLHGAGERGSDVSKLKVNGLPKLIAEGKEFPFIMVAPQCPAESFWAYEIDGLSVFLKAMVEKYPVDTERLYLTGLSMGGFGSWHLAEAHPHAFAAVVPICGGTMPMIGFPERIKVLKKVPIWVFHGADDQVVPLEMSRQLVEALQEVDGDAKFTVYPQVGHDSWTAAYDTPELYDWLLSKSNPAFSWD